MITGITISINTDESRILMDYELEELTVALLDAVHEFGLITYSISIQQT